MIPNLCFCSLYHKESERISLPVTSFVLIKFIKSWEFFFPSLIGRFVVSSEARPRHETIKKRQRSAWGCCHIFTHSGPDGCSILPTFWTVKCLEMLGTLGGRDGWPHLCQHGACSLELFVACNLKTLQIFFFFHCFYLHAQIKKENMQPK